MSGPVSDPIPEPGAAGPVSGGEPPPDDVTALEAELAVVDGGRLARYTARARTATRALAVLVVGTGVLALAVGLGAWRSSAIAMAVVALLCLPAVLLPLSVARRTAALAAAAAQPREVAAQARDLIARVRDSAELRTLAERLARGRGGKDPSPAGPVATPRAGRFRQGMAMARLASTVIGQAQPDEQRHPLLVPFTPERLGRTWSVLVWSLWAWLVAGLVLVVSVPALVVSLF